MIRQKHSKVAVVEFEEEEFLEREETEIEDAEDDDSGMQLGAEEQEDTVEQPSARADREPTVDEEQAAEEPEAHAVEEPAAEAVAEKDSEEYEERLSSLDSGVGADRSRPDDASTEEKQTVEAKVREESELTTAEEVSPEEAAAVRLAIRASSYSPERVQTICESLLFVADRPLNTAAIQSATGIEPRRIREAMEALGGRFREGVSGIVLHEVAGGWQLRSCPTSAEDLRRFLQVKPQRLTRAALETLSIIAYRQPVTRPEIEEIRGVDCGAVVKALLDRGVIQVIGKKEEPGRPLLYATTKAFLELFNLKDLSSLPTLRELHELTEESARIVEESFPEEAARSDRGIADLVEKALASRVEESRNEDETALEDLDAAVKSADEAVKGADGTLGKTSEIEGTPE